MDFEMQEQDGAIVILPRRNQMVGGPDTYEIKDEVKARLGEGHRKFVLDMEEAGFVNSTGIGVVVSMHSSITQAGGRMNLCNVSDRARRAFVVTGVWSLFHVFENRAEALAGFPE